MRKIKSNFKIAFIILSISALTFTSCGGKKDAKNETETEQSEGAEHPTNEDGAEHPAEGDSTEHPTEGDSTEHPSSGEEHPTDN